MQYHYLRATVATVAPSLCLFRAPARVEPHACGVCTTPNRVARHRRNWRKNSQTVANARSHSHRPTVVGVRACNRDLTLAK